MLSHRPRPLLQVEQDGDVTLARIAVPVLDETSAYGVATELSRLVAGRTRPRLRLDLGGVRRLTSAVLGQLLLLDWRLRAVQGELVLVNLSGPVRETLRLTRLLEVFDVQAAEEEDGDLSPPLAS
jgi:anti-anti-sigma factor